MAVAMTRTPLLVWITLPPGMSPETLCREVQASISFGRPEVSLRDPPPPPPQPLIWHVGKHGWWTHDGFPRHQHSMNGVLTIAPGDTAVHFKGGTPF